MWTVCDWSLVRKHTRLQVLHDSSPYRLLDKECNSWEGRGQTTDEEEDGRGHERMTCAPTRHVDTRADGRPLTCQTPAPVSLPPHRSALWGSPSEGRTHPNVPHTWMQPAAPSSPSTIAHANHVTLCHEQAWEADGCAEGEERHLGASWRPRHTPQLARAAPPPTADLAATQRCSQLGPSLCRRHYGDAPEALRP